MNTNNKLETELECRTWYTPLACGTKYVRYPTRLSDLRQFIAVYNSLFYFERGNLPFSVSNVKGLIDQLALAHGVTPEFDYESEYCNLLQPTYDMSDEDTALFLKYWIMEFDLAIHDAAASYLYAAAELTGDDAMKAARISAELWVLSRQLRVMRAEEGHK